MKLFDDMNMFNAAVQGFGFSAVRPDTLGSTEYTLCTLVMDKTGSVGPFSGELNEVRKTVVNACRKSPRAEFLLLRVVEFNTTVDEVHGFLPLASIDPASYSVPTCQGMTALADATFAAVSATNAYARTLADQDYLVNGIVFVATDGSDNSSRMRAADIQREVQTAIQGEHIESMRTILVGINAAQCGRALQSFQQEAGFDQYVDVVEASAQRLAKLADFVSRSISSQSQSLGTGGPSQALVF